MNRAFMFRAAVTCKMYSGIKDDCYRAPCANWTGWWRAWIIAQAIYSSRWILLVF
jgi:hypothetical protein